MFSENGRGDMIRPWLVIAISAVLFASTVSAKTGTAEPISEEMKAAQAAKEVEALKAMVREQAEALKGLKAIVSQQAEEINLLKQKAQKTGAETEVKTLDGSPKKEECAVKPGYGRLKIGGLLQGWFIASGGGVADTFRLRRTEIELSGEIAPEVRWKVMFDPAKALSVNKTTTMLLGSPLLKDVGINQASNMLQDAFITVDLTKRFHIDVGQRKIPISLEGLQSSSTLETVERAMFASDRARGGSYGDVRDFGVMLRTRIGFSEYQLGLFNGSGENQNDVDKNDQKAFIGRVIFRPQRVGGLHFGASGALGSAGLDRARRNRLGGEFQYVRGPWMFKSEVMGGRDGVLNRLGYYAHAGYRINGKLEAIFRFDSWDPDTSDNNTVASALERDYIVGLNYLINEKYAKFQINYLRKTFVGPVDSRNVLLVNLQTSW